MPMTRRVASGDGVRRPNRVAVHGRGGEGRLGPLVPARSFGEDSSGRIAERDGLGLDRSNAGNERAIASSTGIRLIRPSAANGRTGRPAFSTSRTPVIAMPRSIAFAMS